MKFAKIALVGAVALLGGCALLSRVGLPVSGDASDQEVPFAKGKALFEANCVMCHGADATGGGRLADDLPVPPSDLTMLSAANDGLFPAQRVMEEVYGYPGKFHRGLMPEFGPMLEGDPVEWAAPDGEVILTPKPMLDLVSYLESLQQ
ncbi:MAG: cytochrome c [Pelagimonas sp.]|jgi:mono/diheme cytochrome c family protein|nr:cytochrome c [Pelagimonas sp.]